MLVAKVIQAGCYKSGHERLWCPVFHDKVICRIILVFARSCLEGRLCSKAKLLLEKFTENHISGVLCYAKQFQMTASGEKLAAYIVWL